MSGTGETVDLEAFLAGLPEDVAAEGRAAAAKIDALEREIGPPRWIERHLVPMAAVTGAMFLLGIAGFIAGLFSGPGGWFGLSEVVVLLAAFPVLIFAYLVSVKGRTRLDEAKMALNEAHFLPHGGVYFGAAGGGGKVLRVSPPGPKEETEPDLRAKVRAQYDAATKRQW